MHCTDYILSILSSMSFSHSKLLNPDEKHNLTRAWGLEQKQHHCDNVQSVFEVQLTFRL